MASGELVKSVASSAKGSMMQIKMVKAMQQSTNMMEDEGKWGEGKGSSVEEVDYDYCDRSRREARKIKE